LQAQNLREGERLLANGGSTPQALSLAPQAYPELVYNPVITW